MPTTPKKEKNCARRLGETERYFFTYDDIANWTGKSRMSIHQAAHRKLFDPNDFSSVLTYAIRNAREDRRYAVFLAMFGTRRETKD